MLLVLRNFLNAAADAYAVGCVADLFREGGNFQFLRKICNSIYDILLWLSPRMPPCLALPHPLFVGLIASESFVGTHDFSRSCECFTAHL
jgi:hypothetical protein